MFRSSFLILCLVTALGFAPIEGKSFFGVTNAYAAEDSMGQVRLILKKLRSSLTSMKDLDELEDAGMDKVDVDRMRKAMERKIKQMTGDAVQLITAL